MRRGFRGAFFVVTRLYPAMQAADQTLALPVWIAASRAAMTYKSPPGDRR